MEDVFPWDFFPQFFNYRDYFDLITRQITDGTDVRPELRRLLLASLNYYRGFHAPYLDFNGQALDYCRRAAALDPAFPYYQYHLAEEFLQRGLPEDDTEAVRLLRGLLSGSILLLEAFELLSELADGVRPPLQTPGTQAPNPGRKPVLPSPEVLREVRALLDFHRATVDRARSQIEFVVSVAPAMNRIELVRPTVSATRNDARCVSRKSNACCITFDTWSRASSGNCGAYISASSGCSVCPLWTSGCEDAALHLTMRLDYLPQSETRRTCMTGHSLISLIVPTGGALSNCAGCSTAWL